MSSSPKPLKCGHELLPALAPYFVMKVAQAISHYSTAGTPLRAKVPEPLTEPKIEELRQTLGACW